MKTITYLLLFATTFGFSEKQATIDEGLRDDDSPNWSVIQHTLQEVFTGSILGPYSAKIAPQAQLAIGDSLLDLRAVLASNRVNVLRVDADRPPVVIRQKMNGERNAAFLLLRTHRESIVSQHTVVFMKDSTGTWMIESWQTSH